jgi:hypothetical protein
MHDDARKATAYHEAGHTVMGFICGRVPISVDIIPDEHGNAGHTRFSNDDLPDNYWRYFNASSEKQRYVDIRVLIALAGTAAHDLMCPQRQHDTCDWKDEKNAKELIDESMSWDNEHDAAFDRLKMEAYAKISDNMPKIESITAALMRRDIIFERDIHLLIG